MHTRHLATALSLFIPAVVTAQTASDSTPRPGSWGAEVVVRDGSAGASLLRFQSSRTALVLGLDFSVVNIDTDVGGSPLATADGTSSNVAVRLGMRSYRQSSAEKLRPVIGFGTRGSYGKSETNFSTWTAGIYGELGAVYFLTPHVSLGGTGELQANYGKRKQTLGSGTEVEQTTTAFSGSLIRVLLGVYF